MVKRKKRRLELMTSTFFANTNSKIRKLKEDRSYSVQYNSGLSVVKRGKSKYFQGRMRFPYNSSGKKETINIGVFEKDILVEDAIEKWYAIKLWSKENNKNPKLFGQKEEEKITEKTFK